MNNPSDELDELTAIRHELEQPRQDFAAYRKDLQYQITLGIVRGMIGLVIIEFILQLVIQFFSSLRAKTTLYCKRMALQG